MKKLDKANSNVLKTGTKLAFVTSMLTFGGIFGFNGLFILIMYYG